jgi:DNA-binding CsgD family transcriptional regulator
MSNTALTAPTLDEGATGPRASALLRVVPSGRAAPGEAPNEHATLELAELWSWLEAGACFVKDCRFSPHRCHFQLAFRSGARVAGSAQGRRILERVLLGESQKVVGVDLGIAAATISLTCSHVLAAMSRERRVMLSPIPLVMGVHAARGYALPPAFIHAADDPAQVWNLSVERPDRILPDTLTEAEQEIARGVVEGRTSANLAAKRGTTEHTIANQLAAVFRRLRVSGRGELRAEIVKRRAAE